MCETKKFTYHYDELTKLRKDSADIYSTMVKFLFVGAASSIFIEEAIPVSWAKNLRNIGKIILNPTTVETLKFRLKFQSKNKLDFSLWGDSWGTYVGFGLQRIATLCGAVTVYTGRINHPHIDADEEFKVEEAYKQLFLYYIPKIVSDIGYTVAHYHSTNLEYVTTDRLQAMKNWTAVHSFKNKRSGNIVTTFVCSV